MNTAMNPATNNAATTGRTLRGTVVSAKMQDTVTVAVERYFRHRKYKKYIRSTKKYLVHDAGNTAKEGDVVSIRETRPLSRRKRFELIKTPPKAQRSQKKPSV
jgi:small subunit ribosomal protein S17